jgi:4-hydroxy-2-oxoheptanedioate aldolase
MKSALSLRERLAAKGALFGLQQTWPNAAFAELAGLCGFDFLMLDGEHGVFSEADYLHTLHALVATEVLSMVRLPDRNPAAIGRYLDMGVDVIIAPNVSNAQQARELVHAMEYPPKGTRGFGAPLHRGIRYGMDLAAHLDNPRGSACLLPLIESARGVANVDEILDVDGVDGAFIGPSDLSASLGALRSFSTPEYLQAFTRIEQAVLSRGKLLGTAPHAGNPLEALLARGHRIFILDADTSLMREAMTAQIKGARAVLQQRPQIGKPGAK